MSSWRGLVFRDCFSILGFVRSVIFIKRINNKELSLVSGSHSDEDRVCFYRIQDTITKR